MLACFIYILPYFKEHFLLSPLMSREKLSKASGGGCRLPKVLSFTWGPSFLSLAGSTVSFLDMTYSIMLEKMSARYPSLNSPHFSHLSFLLKIVSLDKVVPFTLNWNKHGFPLTCQQLSPLLFTVKCTCQGTEVHVTVGLTSSALWQSRRWERQKAAWPQWSRGWRKARWPQEAFLQERRPCGSSPGPVACGCERLLKGQKTPVGFTALRPQP